MPLLFSTRLRAINSTWMSQLCERLNALEDGVHTIGDPLTVTKIVATPTTLHVPVDPNTIRIMDKTDGSPIAEYDLVGFGAVPANPGEAFSGLQSDCGPGGDVWTWAIKLPASEAEPIFKLYARRYDKDDGEVVSSFAVEFEIPDDFELISGTYFMSFGGSDSTKFYFICAGAGRAYQFDLSGTYTGKNVVPGSNFWASKRTNGNFYRSTNERDEDDNLVRTTTSSAGFTKTDDDRRADHTTSTLSTYDDAGGSLASCDIAAGDDVSVSCIDIDDTAEEVFYSGSSGADNFGLIKVADIETGDHIRTLNPFKEIIWYPLTEWFRYKPGIDDPEDEDLRESVGTYPTISEFLEFTDDTPYFLHDGNLRDWRKAIIDLCEHYLDPDDDPWTANALYQAAVDSSVDNWLGQFEDAENPITPGATGRFHPGFHVAAIEALIVMLEASTRVNP